MYQRQYSSPCATIRRWDPGTRCRNYGPCLLQGHRREYTFFEVEIQRHHSEGTQELQVQEDQAS